MSKELKPYKRLPGSAFLNSNKLYIGFDHLLSISATILTEDYMRFYYKDIQAVITRKTLTGKMLNIIFGILLIIFCIPALRLNGGWSGFFFIITGLFFLLFLVNLFRGPTCVCHIMTPIQTAKLPALRRIRNTKKAMAQFRSLIEGAQGILPQESLGEIQQERKLRPAAKKIHTAIRHEQGTLHIFLFSLLLTSAVFFSIDIFYQNIALSLLSGLISLSLTVLLIISLIKQTGSDLYKALKILTWSTVGYLCVAFISSYVITFYMAMTNPHISNNQWELIKRISGMSPMEYPWLMGLSIFSLSCSLVIGIPGLVLINKFRKEYESSQTNLQPSQV